jgi:hypothetical protein
MRSRNKAPAAHAAPASRRSCLIEGLESRQLLSASSGILVHPDLTVLPAATGGAVNGFTPAQIRHAYGFDKVKFNGVAADGTGQTIAIVDAFRDPHITGDLAVFDAKFGLAAPPSFAIVNQRGGSVKSVPVDSGWASEIALDVEWSHAIAPKARLALIETDSDDLDNLLAGVKTARSMAGVSVVSMSWGGPEFFGQQNKDSTFTTPANHAPVTFVAASGDEGSFGGAEWPASSPNVLSVGGTSLFTLDNAGTYANEAPWSDSSGGVSRMEKTPAYQKTVNASRRSTPDVAYDADPYSGFAVYDSVADQGYLGWQEVGGTSAGTPQWSALIAIADQGRALLHKAALDGVANTLPALYGVYNTSVYSADYHDIVSGWHAFSARAHTGYDLATGLGTPHADQIIPLLVAIGKATVTATGSSTGSSSSTGSTGGTTTSGQTSRSTDPSTTPQNLHPGWNLGDGSGVDPTPNDPDSSEHAGGLVQHPSSIPPALQPQASVPRTSEAQPPASSAPTVVTKGSSLAAAASAVAASQAAYVAKAGLAVAENGARAISDATFTVHGAAASPQYTLSATAAASMIGREVLANFPSAQSIADAIAAIAIPSASDGEVSVGAAQLSAAPSAPMTASAAATAARAFFHIAPIDAQALFSDAVASFASQCAAVTGPAVAESTPARRAWAITAGVLVIDAALLGRWYARRRGARCVKSRDHIFRDGSPLTGP